MKVAIVGGGMALALSLHDAGITDVDVYESAPAVKELGVGINVLPHAVRELTELGLPLTICLAWVSPPSHMVHHALPRGRTLHLGRGR
jgi:5-methylphenazine-1-carboxylate 1-monooxygenase